MATRLVLLCCAATARARAGGFAAVDEGLDSGGRANAQGLQLGGAAVVSPAAAAMETAAACGLVATSEPRLRDQDFGAWAGLSFDAIPAAALGAWLAAPERGAPGGETLEAVAARVAGWLDEQRAVGGTVQAVTHAMVIRALLARALGIAPAATLGVDIAPLGRVVLSFNGRWRLQTLG